MKFFCIHEKEDTTFFLLKKACSEKGIEFFGINADKFDFLNPPVLEKSDMLYRISTSARAVNVEKNLYFEGLVTFYSKHGGPRASMDPISTYKANNIAMPKTLNLFSRDRDLLQKYVEFLGGFPIIIKSLGGSHGVGVMKIDSFSSLFSVVDYLLVSQKKAKFILREYIDIEKSARLIVLGDKVVDSIEYAAPSGDFRTNVGKKLSVSKKTFSDDVQNTAIKGVNARGFEFGGVDILIDRNGEHYLIEANFPCFFPRCQMLTGVDISGMMLDYLVQKNEDLKVTLS